MILSPELEPPDTHGTLPEHGSLPQPHKYLLSPQRYRNRGTPEHAPNIIHPARAEIAKRAFYGVLEIEGTHKPDAHALLTEDPTYVAAMHNDLKPVNPALEKLDVDKDVGIDMWLNTNGRVVIIGGYGESRASLEALGRALAEREGFDFSRVDIITMVEGFKNLDEVRRLVADAALVATHSAGMTVLQEAFKGEDAAKYLRPGMAQFYNPPSENQRPIGLESSESKRLSLRRLLTGAALVAVDDASSHGIKEEIKWRWGWAKEVFGHPIKSLKSLPKIVKHARNFSGFTMSLAGRDGTQVVIPISRWDHFFHLTSPEREKLGGAGAIVLELPLADGYHNAPLFNPLEAEIGVSNTLDFRASQQPDGPEAVALADRRRHAELRRERRRRLNHRGLGLEPVGSDARDRKKKK